MDRTDKKQIIFRSGKELLEQCKRKLSENQQGDTGGNVALYPTVVVFLGEKCKEFATYVKNTLDDNWNNARFLEYIHIVKSGKGFKCRTIVKNDDRYDLQWSDSTSPDWLECLNKAISTMLETDERYFGDKSRIKMEFILDTTEKDSNQYYELYKEARNKLLATDLKTLYLMIDQRPENGNSVKSDELLKYILSNRSESGTIYLISNYLSTGDILGEREIWKNYRLVSNIVLLGGNKGDDVLRDRLYSGIKTVSYALETKPIDEIAEVSLSVLIDEIYESEKKDNVELSYETIRKKIGITSVGGIDFAEEMFNKSIAPNLPDELDMRFLPYRSSKDYKDIQAKKPITDAELDNVTLGVWSTFIDRYYIKPIDKYFGDEERLENLKTRIYSELLDAFSLFELLELSKDKDYIISLIKEDYIYSGGGDRDSFEERLHNRACYLSKKAFYLRIKNVVAEVFEDVLELAKQFEKNYFLCKKEVKLESIPNDIRMSVENKYTDVVKDFVKDKEISNRGITAFPNIFNVRYSKEELLHGFWDCFNELVKQEIYSYDFEKEKDCRLNSVSELQKQIIVNHEIQNELTGKMHLKFIHNINEINEVCFYLINKKAEYAKQLEKNPDNGLRFTMFNLNRTDSMEKVEIFNIMKPELLQLSSAEVTKDVNNEL